MAHEGKYVEIRLFLNVKSQRFLLEEINTEYMTVSLPEDNDLVAGRLLVLWTFTEDSFSLIWTIKSEICGEKVGILRDFMQK